jgi:hypothetical protein
VDFIKYNNKYGKLIGYFKRLIKNNG